MTWAKEVAAVALAVFICILMFLPMPALAAEAGVTPLDISDDILAILPIIGAVAALFAGIAVARFHRKE